MKIMFLDVDGVMCIAMSQFAFGLEIQELLNRHQDVYDCIII